MGGDLHINAQFLLYVIIASMRDFSDKRIFAVLRPVSSAIPSRKRAEMSVLLAINHIVFKVHQINAVTEVPYAPPILDSHVGVQGE
jgi:hypothetical protein